MGRVSLLLLSLFLVLLLAACGGKETSDSYTVTRGDTVYTVDRVEKTIFDGTNTYRYTFAGDAEAYSVNITYPDGSTYYWDQGRSNGVASVGQGGWSEDYDPDRYVSGETLRSVLVAGAPAYKEPKNVLVIIVLLAVGVFNVAAPRAAWYISKGWQFKDAEPSDLALTVSRGSGIVALIVAAVLIFT